MSWRPSPGDWVVVVKNDPDYPDVMPPGSVRRAVYAWDRRAIRLAPVPGELPFFGDWWVPKVRKATPEEVAQAQLDQLGAEDAL